MTKYKYISENRLIKLKQEYESDLQTLDALIEKNDGDIRYFQGKRDKLSETIRDLEVFLLK